MKKWKLEIILEVADSWIADGFDAGDPERIEQVEELLATMLPYAYGHEFKVKAKIVSAPTKDTILTIQGYK